MYVIKTLIHTNKTKETGCGLMEGDGVRGCGRQAGRPGSFGPGHVRPSLPPRQLRGPARPWAGSSRGTGNGGGTRKRGPGPSALIPSTTGAQTAPGVPLPGVPALRACTDGCTAGEWGGKGGGTPRSSEVRASPGFLTDCPTSRPNPLRGMCLEDGEESLRPKWPQAGGVLPSPQNEASLYLLHLYPPAGQPILGRTPRPNTLLGDGAEMGQGREPVAKVAPAGEVLPTPEG